MGLIDRISYLAAAALVTSGLFHLAVYAVDGGPWEGPVSWRKPVTFGLSFGITLATITWVASYVRLAPRTRNWLSGLFTAACAAEVVLISVQAWRHVPSHFNEETPVDATIAHTLAAGGGLIIMVIGWLTVAAFRPNPDTAASMRLAVRVGLGSLMGALAVGATMIAQGAIMIAKGDREGAYLHGGALKPAHAALMHGITLLPVLARLLTFGTSVEAKRVRVVGLAAAGYLTAAAAVAAGTFLNALTSPAVLAVTALGVAAMGIASAVTVADLVRRPVHTGIGAG
jgi:hypothetical protein